MKLIDLLVQELPRRGGWPVGPKFIAADKDGMIYTYENEPKLDSTMESWIDEIGDGYFGYCNLPSTEVSDWNTVTITRKQYKSALAASKQVEWDGEGLPPVGCECEWQDKNTQQWIKVSIVYASEWVTVIREDKIADPVEIAIENYGDEGRKKFRPVRSEQEVKREEVIDGIVGFFIGYHAYPKGAEEYLKVAKALHCAIAAGKIPGVKLYDL